MVDILYTSLTEKLLNTNTEGKKMANPQKEVQVKLMKGLLDLIILQFLSTQPMHGYQVITKIRKTLYEPLYHCLCCIKTRDTGFTKELLNTKG